MSSLADLKIGIIGLGSMSGAILKGLIHSGVQVENAWAVCSSSERAVHRQREFKIQCFGTIQDIQGLQGVDVLLLGVKPLVMPHVLQDLKEALAERPLNEKTIVISVAAGVTLAHLQEALGEVAIVRSMPNTPALVQAGLTALVANDFVSQEHRVVVESVFGAVGRYFWLKESQLNAFTALFGSGPAYVMLIMEALAEAGLAEGLPHDVVWEGVTQLLKGSALLQEASGKLPAQLKKEVITPQGTTIAGLQALEANGLRHALGEAVRAATHRADELSQSISR
jgi:pyrroline-5-carboxylate reductase